MQDNCWFGDMLKDEMRKRQFKHELGRLSNRILPKVQKSFWSCTHVNSCKNYTVYINLHIY